MRGKGRNCGRKSTRRLSQGKKPFDLKKRETGRNRHVGRKMLEILTGRQSLRRGCFRRLGGGKGIPTRKGEKEVCVACVVPPREGLSLIRRGRGRGKVSDNEREENQREFFFLGKKENR